MLVASDEATYNNDNDKDKRKVMTALKTRQKTYGHFSISHNGKRTMAFCNLESSATVNSKFNDILQKPVKLL